METLMLAVANGGSGKKLFSEYLIKRNIAQDTSVVR
jgi:hypothetical protein